MEKGKRIESAKTNSALYSLVEALRDKSLKITDERLSILDVLVKQTKPITIKELHQITGKQGCDLATIYRLFNLLEKHKLIQRTDFGDGIARFELLTADRSHHHHIICIYCSTVVKVDECFIESIQEEIANRSGFKSITHKLEFFGICPRCQKKE